MKVTRNPKLAAELLAEMTAANAEDRSQQHPSVSDLVYCLTKSWWNYKATNDGTKQPKLSEKTQVYFLIGLGLERSLLGSRKQNPTSGQRDGIWFHADAFSDDVLIELKSTRGSKKKYDEGDFPLGYIRQCKSYCVALGVREVDLAVVFVIPAEFEVYHIEFSEPELWEHWQWMQKRKAVWDMAVGSGVEPESFKYNEEFECRSCEYKLICDLRTSLRSIGIEPATEA